MALGGIDTQQSPPAFSLLTQVRKPETALRPNEDAAHRTKEPDQKGVASPIQDQVTLSKESQNFSDSNSQPQRNNTFQQSTSPFDK